MIPFFSILIHGDYAGSGSPRILKNEEFQGNQGRRKKQNNPKSTLLSRLYKKGLYTLWKEKIRRQSNRLYIRQCIHTHCLYHFQRIYMMPPRLYTPLIHQWTSAAKPIKIETIPPSVLYYITALYIRHVFPTKYGLIRRCVLEVFRKRKEG